MKISVRVKSGAKQNCLQALEDGTYLISVKAVPEKGKANIAVVAILAEYFEVAKRQVQVLSGHTSKQKILVIDR